MASIAAAVGAVVGLFIGNSGAVSFILPGTPKETVVTTLPAETVTVYPSAETSPAALNAGPVTVVAGDYEVTAQTIENRPCPEEDGKLCGQVVLKVNSNSEEDFTFNFYGEDVLTVVDSAGHAHSLTDLATSCSVADVTIPAGSRNEVLAFCFEEEFSRGDTDMSVSLRGSEGMKPVSLNVSGLKPADVG